MQQALIQIIDSCFQAHGYAFRVDAAGECLPHDDGEQVIAQLLSAQTLTELKKLHKDADRLQALVDGCADQLYRDYYIDAVRHRIWRCGNRRRTKLDRAFRKTFGQRMVV